MEYIVTKRYKGNSLSGKVNIPYGTVCMAAGKYIISGNRLLCLTTSQDAYDHFSRNDDGLGRERGALVHKILDMLRTPHPPDAKVQARWERVWADPDLQRFKRPEHKDFWVWSFDFYNASLPDLQKIFDTVKGV